MKLIGYLLNMKHVCIVGVLIVSVNTGFAGWWKDVGNALLSSTNAQADSSAKGSPVSAVASLPVEQAVSGLKEALGKGVQSAVKSLGHEGGFLNNLDVKIPLPEKLQKAESALRILGQGKLADDFVATMNRAAEQAVPVATGVFGDAIKQMSFADAKAVLAGPNDAATQYFRKTTQTNLFNRFLPIVKAATEKAGVTSSYKQMVSKVGAAQSLGGLLNGKMTALPDQADLDQYVTNKALDGLFKMVAEEEKRIRENPLARTTDLLQKVFGSAPK